MVTEPGYEVTDARTRPIVYGLIALGLLFVLGLGAAYVVVRLGAAQVQADQAEVSPLYERRLPDNAPLLADEPGYAKKIMREQRTHLESYGWTDQRNGRAHVPIDRAIELYLGGTR